VPALPEPEPKSNQTPPLSFDEKSRIRFTAECLASRLAGLQGRIPPDTWRNYAARQIGDAMIAERNRRAPRGVAEMVRAVRPGGMVATYAWDMLGGGFPFEPILVELRALGISYPQPPSADASRIDALKELWEAAGLEAVETQEIRVQRTFASFEEFWTTTVSGGTNVGRTLSELPADTLALLRQRVQTRLPADAAGRITYGAHANAVKGQVRQAIGR
jgi:hypothetical protein